MSRAQDMLARAGKAGLSMAGQGARAMLRAVPGDAPTGPAAPGGPLGSAPRANARANLIRVLATRLGAAAPGPEIAEVLARHAGPGDTYDAACLSAGIRAAGLRPETFGPLALGGGDSGGLWPALALMHNGQAVLVLAQSPGGLVVYDETSPGHTSEVALSEFLPVFSGYLVGATVTAEDLFARHAGGQARQHWFWGAFGRFRRQFAEIALGSLVANLLAVAVALFSLQVYDRVIPHQSQSTLWVLAAGAALALCLEGALKIARARLMDSAGRQIEMGVQGLLMERLIGMRSDLAGRSPAQLFSAMRDFGAVREFFTASTAGALADIPFLFVFLLLVWSIAGPVVLVLVIGGALMVLPGLLMQKRMIRLTEEMQGASVRQARLLQEVVADLDTLKAQRGEDRVRRLWSEMSAVQSLKSSDQRSLGASLGFWAQGVQQATYLVAVIAGTYLVFAGEFTVGTIIAVGILSSRTLAPLTQLSGLLARWGNVRAALNALDVIAEAPQDRALGRSYLRRPTLEGDYELRELSYAYADDAPAVVDLPALNIQAGQVLAVLGANGSGKSTLLKLLSGLYAPSSGRVLLDGTEIGQIDPGDLRRGIGYLAQEVRLFHGSLRDNLDPGGLEGDDARLFAALDFAGLGAFVKAHPRGLDLAIADGGLGLSVGQRQSIGWARLWLQDPRICLLDEPTAALDQTLEKTLISRLETWLEGRTAVIATHRVPILGLASRTLILSQGRLAVDGPRDQVLDHLRKGVG